ncbi:neuropeptide FF receptor 2-like isoform X2 [Dendronephthya gigantea]|nr:neuropeptide FF receptor 2-like isoform X2 [Dendronephthya gigantea]
MIANLAIADLMVALFCMPATLVYMELKTWPFGYAMCKMITFVQSISVMGSVGTLTVISIDRYRCIVHTFASRLSMSVLRYIVCLIWSVALVPALPLLGANTIVEFSPTLIYCVEKWPDVKYRTIYNTVSFALTYAIPLAIMCLLYIKIAIALNKVVREGGNREGFTNQKKKDKVLRMLLALVIAYAVCFLPVNIMILWSEYGDSNRYWLLLQAYAVLLVYVNSASNPVLYAFMGKRFKDGFKRLLCCRKFPKFNRRLSRINQQSAVTREFALSERSS